LKNYIQNSGIYDNKESAWNEILSLSEIYLNNGSVFDFRYKNIEGRKVEIEVISYKRLCKEICMIGIFIAGIISSIMTAQDDENKLFGTIKKNQKSKYQIIQIYAVILLFTVIYIISFSLNKSYINIKEYIFILFYGIACAIYSCVLLKVFQKPEFLASVTIIGSVICIICCPVITDFSLYCPYLKLIRWALPPWYYYVMI
ncbi:MAG: hypothetical protein IJO13_05360, partial [Lachnospiraceae bacterium]|nr:hypothetical protein [Lachnospiraceae bacterium]